MDFVWSHFGKINLWPVEHFFEHICHHIWVGLLWVQQQTHPKVMTNMLKKMFNWSEVHLSEVTFYKILTLLAHSDFQTMRHPWPTRRWFWHSLTLDIRIPSSRGNLATQIGFNCIFLPFPIFTYFDLFLSQISWHVFIWVFKSVRCQKYTSSFKCCRVMKVKT